MASPHIISIGNPEKHGDGLKNAYISYEISSIIVSFISFQEPSPFYDSFRMENQSKSDADTKISCGSPTVCLKVFLSASFRLCRIRIDSNSSVASLPISLESDKPVSKDSCNDSTDTRFWDSVSCLLDSWSNQLLA